MHIHTGPLIQGVQKVAMCHSDLPLLTVIVLVINIPKVGNLTVQESDYPCYHTLKDMVSTD